MTRSLSRTVALAATTLALAAVSAPALGNATSTTPGPDSGAAAKLRSQASGTSTARGYGRLCGDLSRKRVGGQRGTPFSRCVTALAQLARAKTRSPRKACRSLGAGSAFDECVSAGRRLLRVGNGIDRAFVDNMIPHHESAVQMANLAHVRGRSPYIHTLASDIIRTQQAEIASMRGIASRLERLGVKPRSLGLSVAEMGMDHDVSHLVAAEPFDQAFFTMMIPHHQGAINMARVQLRKGTGRQARALARQIMAAQEHEIQLMRQQLGAAPPPAGGLGDTHGHH